MRVVTVYTDASYHQETKVGGWGVWFRDSECNFQKSGGWYKAVSSSEAEERAACNGIHYAHQLLTSKHYIKGMIVLVTDCKGVKIAFENIMQSREIRKPTKPRNWFLKFCNETLTDTTLLKINHVKAHTNGLDNRSMANRTVDNLAYEEMDVRRTRKRAKRIKN